ncbi:hypothetical protein [Dyadobacter sp. NIV53]|uniref:hypothetical protein n=1 Tax=Dyadobacter sp. NIV53 TaxID=2861765 RepID=UPI001C882E0B|nr:hypothetical protein [Dyadobacter sp. NIV53]
MHVIAKLPQIILHVIIQGKSELLTLGAIRMGIQPASSIELWAKQPGCELKDMNK